MPALLHESDFTLLNPDNHPSSPSLADAVAFALQKYPGFNFLPSNYDSIDTHLRNASPATAHFSCDDFRMYEFKVRRCMRGRSHDWTECPFAHPGEKARRRDPRRIHYSGAPCPDFRKGSCRRGDACEFAHGVFECWLHPARYRTQVCKDGKNCKRRVCFFAHSPEQLRILPSSPSSTHAHSETGDRSPVGSPGSFLSQHNYSLEIPSSPSVVGSAGSTSKYLMTDGTCMPNAAAENNCIKGFSSASTMLPSPSSNLAASNTYMSHPTHEVSPISMHYLDSLNAGSPLRRAMAQSFLAGKSYSGASFGLNVPNASITEYPPAYDTFGPLCTSPQSHLGSCNSKLREAKLLELSLPLGSLENSHSYEFSSYSHGFASPTSTLAGHTFSPPPLSPPLSPLSSPNPSNCQHKGSFTNSGHSQLHNFYVDDTTYRGSTTESFRNYTDCMEDLAFRLQQLQVPEIFEPMGFPLQINSHESARHGMLENAPLKSPPSKLSSLGRIAHGISCTPEQSMWSPLNQNSSKDHNIDLLLSDASTQEMMVKICGEESFGADNVIPDFGWVSELVK